MTRGIVTFFKINFYFDSIDNGAVISPLSKQHETCQSVPRSPQTQQQHHLHHHLSNHHPLYSNEQPQSFASPAHASVYVDLQPYPSSVSSNEIVYPENVLTSTTNGYYPTNSSPSNNNPLHPSTSSSAYYLTPFPSSSSSSSSVLASNTIVDYPQSVRL